MEVPCDKPFPEEQARLYLRDIVLGLEYCEWRTGPFLSVYTNLPISFSGGRGTSLWVGPRASQRDVNWGL